MFGTENAKQQDWPEEPILIKPRKSIWQDILTVKNTTVETEDL